MTVLGLVTIGQAPRSDMAAALARLLPDGVDLVQEGALDGTSCEALPDLAPRSAEATLTTALRSGRSVRVDRDLLAPLVGDAIGRAEKRGAAAVLFVCTGSFAALESRVPLLHAERLLLYGVAALVDGVESIGVVAPLPEQEEALAARWRRDLEQRVLTNNADPYADDALEMVRAAARRLADGGARLLVLDCMGYTDAARMAAAEAGVPVVLARGVVARLTAELVAGLPPGTNGAAGQRAQATAQPIPSAGTAQPGS